MQSEYRQEEESKRFSNYVEHLKKERERREKKRNSKNKKREWLYAKS